jgi:hypothetical protein
MRSLFSCYILYIHIIINTFVITRDVNTCRHCMEGNIQSMIQLIGHKEIQLIIIISVLVVQFDCKYTCMYIYIYKGGKLI